MNYETVLIITGVAAGLMLICVLLLLNMYRRIRKDFEALLASFHNLEVLNSTLRTQRHDQMNHLQVVYGMIELGEYDEIKEYLKPIFTELQKTGKALRTSKPAVNALIMAKQQEAEREDIDFFVEVKSSLETLEIPDWELCKILANLIDNAMTALHERQEERRLRVDITEERDAFVFEIANNGPAIDEDMIETIFKQGFSTKKEEGHGMGLSIVKKAVTEAGGTITCRSDSKETAFTVRLYKEKQK